MKLSGRHRSTIDSIFADPVRSNVLWSDVEALIGACEAEIVEGRGSRVRITLREIRAVFHRPHPSKETDKEALKIRSAFPDRGRGDPMTTMHLGAYQAVVEFDDEAGFFHGEIVNLRDVVTFQGRPVDELRQAFADSVSDYLAYCAERGEAPESPANSQLSVKVDPGLHRAVLSAARRSGVTPDEWVSRALERASS